MQYFIPVYKSRYFPAQTILCQVTVMIPLLKQVQMLKNEEELSFYLEIKSLRKVISWTYRTFKFGIWDSVEGIGPINWLFFKILELIQINNLCHSTETSRNITRKVVGANMSDKYHEDYLDLPKKLTGILAVLAWKLKRGYLHIARWRKNPWSKASNLGLTKTTNHQLKYI